jgi:sulfate permease, SulP family
MSVSIACMSEDCRKLLQNEDKIIDINILDDPTYRVVIDKE